MGTFRNQLLALIIGLIAVTQSVTLVAVLARVERSVEARAGEQLAAGGIFIDQLLRFRATQLANGVAVLAADFGFREAVASGDEATMLSAADNHMRRIGAALMLLMDNHGRLLTSTAPLNSGTEDALRQLIAAGDMASDHPHVIAIGEQPYQLFLAPVRAPEVIGWVAMGFAV
ncbi:MAG TPA: cache domain-containing protein, partial [Steroidobacteraceae bacterium]|nr:cache domain-containing protein [Steroidobacteraceae bacterium]